VSADHASDRVGAGIRHPYRNQREQEPVAAVAHLAQKHEERRQPAKIQRTGNSPKPVLDVVLRALRQRVGHRDDADSRDAATEHVLLARESQRRQRSTTQRANHGDVVPMRIPSHGELDLRNKHCHCHDGRK
jgi:hypothetical protein